MTKPNKLREELYLVHGPAATAVMRNRALTHEAHCQQNYTQAATEIYRRLVRQLDTPLSECPLMLEGSTYLLSFARSLDRRKPWRDWRPRSVSRSSSQRLSATLHR